MFFHFSKLKKATEELKQSKFSFDLLQNLDYCIKEIASTAVGEIICFGLGNFSDSKSALHQLAVLVTLYEKYKSRVIIYDPVFNLIEINILQSLGFKVLVENEEGKRKVPKEQISLIFLPHCPKQLINNFLWANWTTSLRNCILLTNSFSNIIQTNTTKTIKKSANYIFKIHPLTKEIVIEDSYKYNNTFNDLSIHYFNHCELVTSFFTDSLEVEPIYSENTEFITKGISSLDIKI